MRRARTVGLAIATAFAAACGGSATGPSASEATTALPTTTAATTAVPAAPDNTGVTTTAVPATDVLADGDSYVGPLTFAWPTDCSVPVTGGFARYGRDGELREGASFEMRLVLSGESRLVTIAPQDFAITAPDQLSDEQRASLGRQLLPPTFVVDARGAVAEVRGLEQSNALFDSGPGSQASGVELDALEHHYRTWVWGPWAGMWAAFGMIEPGDSIGSTELTGHPRERFATEVWEPPPSANGVVLTSATVREPGLAHLFAHVDVELASADPLSQIEALQAPDLTDAGVSVSAQIDPATLRPGGLIVRRTFFAEAESGIQESRDDRWEFDWLGSDCAP